MNRAEGLGVELDPVCEEALAKGLISRRLRGGGADRLWRQTRSSLSLLCDAGNYVTSELQLPRGGGDDGGVWVIGRQGAAMGLCWRVLGRAVGSTPAGCQQVAPVSADTSSSPLCQTASMPDCPFCFLVVI